MNKTYKTQNIETASTIKAATMINPAITFDETGLATFTFPEYSEVADVVMHYESGLMVDARSLLTTRNQLFKRVRGGAK